MKSLKEVSVEDILGFENEVNDAKAKGIHGTKTWVLAILRQNPDGITAKMVSEIVGISERRSRDILDELVMKREAYFREVQGVKIYYPNGKLIHKYLQESREFGNQIFRLSFHEGKKEPILQIQERKFSLLDGERVEGSIFVELENVEPLVEFILEMLDKYNTFEFNRKRR